MVPPSNVDIPPVITIKHVNKFVDTEWEPLK